MAIILPGNSCQLCGRPLDEQEPAINLPPISDRSSELYPLFNSSYHEECYYALNKTHEIAKLIEKEQAKLHQSASFIEMIRQYGPPKYLEELYTEVINSFKDSNSNFVVFLKWRKGKLSSGTILDNLQGIVWRVKYQQPASGSGRAMEKILDDEAANIFQYIIEGVNTSQLPAINSYLKIQY